MLSLVRSASVGCATFFAMFGSLVSAADLPAALRSFIDKRCLECHDAESKKGGLDLSTLKADLSEAATLAKWVRVHDRVQAGEMPPLKRALPKTERDDVLKNLSAMLMSAELQRYRAQGRVPLRRLNRSEYENTMRDLFSLPGIQVKEFLPEDGRFDGFDKASQALDISAVQLRKYLEAADHVLDTAIAHQAKPMVWKHRFRRIGGLAQFSEASFPINDGKADMVAINEIRRKRADGRNMPLQERGPILEAMDSLGIITHARPSFRPDVENFSAFHSGYYRIRTSVWSFHYHREKNGELMPAERLQSFALTADGRLLAYLDAPPLKPKEHDLVLWLNATESLELNAANLWGNFHSPLNYEGDGVAVDYVDIEGPLNDTWPPASHRRLFGNLPIAELPVRREASPPETYPSLPPLPKRQPGARPSHIDSKEFTRGQPVWTAASPRAAEDAERLLKDFLPRAFRRPVEPEEVAVYVQIARERLVAGDFFETAMRAAYRTALCSPDFLFLVEPTGLASKTDPMALDQHAIASRLSYFLWNSMPDDVLLALATNRKLNGKVLGEQIDRLLGDPKSERFIEDFLDQWLELREINFTSPDAKLYPEFRPDLRDAMLAESRAFFRELIDKDLGVSNIIDSDFLMINQRLAEHYEIAGVDGSAIRRVARPEGNPRGGFLTHAGVLKVTANGTLTSPVTRGAFVMDRILGRPPLPPPPDVPAVDPDIRGTTTIREQLDKHRNNGACVSCHAKIDPPGFALESFDVIGGWRMKYRFVGEKVEDPAERKGDDPPKDRFRGVLPKQWEHVLNNVRLGLPVDASGVTADGAEFKDIIEYKKLMLEDQEGLARNLVERLVLYATGVPVGFADRPQVEQILQRSRESEFGVRSLIRELAMNRTIFHRK